MRVGDLAVNYSHGSYADIREVMKIEDNVRLVNFYIAHGWRIINSYQDATGCSFVLGRPAHIKEMDKRMVEQFDQSELDIISI